MSKLPSKLTRLILEANMRIFYTFEVKALGLQHGISDVAVMVGLLRARKSGDIEMLHYGLNCLAPKHLGERPIHPFEIAMKLTKNGAISHHTAMQFHGLASVPSDKIYLTKPKYADTPMWNPSVQVPGQQFFIKMAEPHYFFGVEEHDVDGTKVCITSLEKTLLDSLSHPEYCGGFDMAVQAFERGLNRINAEKLIAYGHKLRPIMAKRAGWVLEKLGAFEDVQKNFEAIAYTPAFHGNLDKYGLKGGKLNKRWNLRENIWK